MSAPSRILVTGASGFTGKALCASLQARGYDVFGLSSMPSNAAAACPMLVGDLLNPEALNHALQHARPQQVVHLAARAFVGSDDSTGFYQTNVTGTCNLLDAARVHGVERVVVASSANVYGVPANVQPLSESVVPAPVNHYAASKLAMEHMARTYTDYFDLIITRPFNYTGPSQDPAYLVPKLVKSFRDKRPSIQLGNLDVARDFTSLDDVVSAYIALLESSLTEGTFNICSGQVIPLQQLIAKLVAFSGHAPEINSTTALARRNDIPVLCGDNRLLCKSTGWQITLDIDAILQRMLNAN